MDEKYQENQVHQVHQDHQDHEIAIFTPKIEDIEQLILDRFDWNLASDRLEIAKELGLILNWFYTGEADF